MELSDDAIRAILRDPAKQPPSARHMGFEIIDFSVKDGWADVAFTPRPEFANPAGVVQGGFVCAMLDNAMSVAARCCASARRAWRCRELCAMPKGRYWPSRYRPPCYFRGFAAVPAASCAWLRMILTSRAISRQVSSSV